MADRVFIYERTPEDELLIARAADYARLIHRRQFRKSVDNVDMIPYIEGLRTHPIHTCRVSAADKISNMRATIADADVHGANILLIFGNSIRRNLPLGIRRDRTLWYHRTIGEVFADRASDLGTIAQTYADTFREFEGTLAGFGELSMVETTN